MVKMYVCPLCEHVNEIDEIHRFEHDPELCEVYCNNCDGIGTAYWHKLFPKLELVVNNVRPTERDRHTETKV